MRSFAVHRGALALYGISRGRQPTEGHDAQPALSRRVWLSETAAFATNGAGALFFFHGEFGLPDQEKFVGVPLRICESLLVECPAALSFNLHDVGGGLWRLASGEHECTTLVQPPPASANLAAVIPDELLPRASEDAQLGGASGTEKLYAALADLRRRDGLQAVFELDVQQLALFANWLTASQLRPRETHGIPVWRMQGAARPNSPLRLDIAAADGSWRAIGLLMGLV